jgi:hypothetical protein
MAQRAREGLMSDLSPAEQREIEARMKRYRRASRNEKIGRTVKTKAKEIWRGHLPFFVLCGGAIALILWKKKKDAEAVKALTAL